MGAGGGPLLRVGLAGLDTEWLAVASTLWGANYKKVGLILKTKGSRPAQDSVFLGSE